MTWFLVGGDLYTAYTFIAVPALLYGAGAVGFFAVPYTIVVYPLVFLAAPRLWSVSHRHGYVTPADFVRGRHGSPTLALAVAVTGIVATMPYIALQLVGIEAVLKAMGIDGTWPLWIAFAILAAYTYQSGLRAPALIAFVKDGLIYLVVITAVVVIPAKIGGWHAIFAAADAKFAATPRLSDGTLLPSSAQLGYSTLALGSALALFLYPHSVTGLLAARSRDTIKRNMAALPAYSLILGLIALLGYMAIAAGVTPVVTGGKPDSNTVVPLLFGQMFPHWFAGVAYAAVGIGALVPAAIMSIAAANLFTRNVYREYLKPDATPAEEARVSRIMSLLVKLGAVLVVILLDPQFSIDLQLIGGVIILQTLPALVFGLYTRWFHRGALLAGWAVGLLLGLWMASVTPTAGPTGAVVKQHWGGSLWALSHLGLDTKVTIYTGFVAVVANIAVAAVLTPVLRAVAPRPESPDATHPDDYDVEAASPEVRTITFDEPGAKPAPTAGRVGPVSQRD